MLRTLAAVAIVLGQAALSAASLLASQGPGVGPGNATPFQQFVAAMTVVGLGVGVAVIALVLVALGGQSRE
jgi:hypothetical protein